MVSPIPCVEAKKKLSIDESTRAKISGKKTKILFSFYKKTGFARMSATLSGKMTPLVEAIELHEEP
jgi:hypothetical protein